MVRAGPVWPETFMGIPAVMKPHSNTDVGAGWLLWSHAAEQVGASQWEANQRAVTLGVCATLFCADTAIFPFLFISCFLQDLPNFVHITTELSRLQYNRTFIFLQ